MPLAWFGQREREVPSTLAAQLRGTLAEVARGEATQIPDRLLDAGVELVTTVATAEPMTRDHALDLLTADALITYAFEAAAEQPERLVARADAAMHRIAAVGL
jgi:hypothetical protein